MNSRKTYSSHPLLFQYVGGWLLCRDDIDVLNIFSFCFHLPTSSATSSVSSTSALVVLASSVIIVPFCNDHQPLIGFRLRRMIIVCCRIFRRLIVACCVTSYVSSTSAVVASSMIIVSVCNEHQSLIGFRQIIVVCSRIFRRLIVACWCWLLCFFLNWLPIAADHLTALVTDGLAVL